MATGLWNTPPYLFDVRLELWTDGEPLIPASDAIGMGKAFELEITLIDPAGNSLSFVNDHRAGVAAGLGVSAGAEAYAPPNGDPQNTLEVLGKMVADYLSSVDDFGARLAQLEGLTRVFPRPSVVTVGSIVEPVGSLGLIEALDYKSVFVDADMHGGHAVGSNADRDVGPSLADLEPIGSFRPRAGALRGARHGRHERRPGPGLGRR